MSASGNKQNPHHAVPSPVSWPDRTPEQDSVTNVAGHRRRKSNELAPALANSDQHTAIPHDCPSRHRSHTKHGYVRKRGTLPSHSGGQATQGTYENLCTFRTRPKRCSKTGTHQGERVYSVCGMHRKEILWRQITQDTISCRTSRMALLA